MRPVPFISRAAFLSMSLVAAPALADDPAGEDVLTMRVEGEVEVGPEGRVISHTVQTKVTEDIRALIERKVAGWTFHRPTKDGAPAIARGKMRITLAARKDGDNYGVSMDNVTFLADANRQSPRGRWAIVVKGGKHHRFQAAGAVSMAIRVAPDGRILEAFPSQCTVFAVERGMSLSKTCRNFERHGLKAVTNWTLVYRPAPGEATPSSRPGGTLPLFFQQGVHTDPDATSPGRWRIEWRTPYKKAPWHQDSAPRIGVSDVSERDGFVPDSSDLRLQTDSTGDAPG